MIITVNLAIICILVCFISGIVMGVLLMKPRYYTGSRGHLSASIRRYEE